MKLSIYDFPILFSLKNKIKGSNVFGGCVMLGKSKKTRSAWYNKYYVSLPCSCVSIEFNLN